MTTATLLISILSALVPVLPAPSAPATGAEAEATAEAVVAFARSKLGQGVGDGECTGLVLAALEHSGARRPAREGDPWGEPRAALEEIRPGDILTFEDARFRGRSRGGPGRRPRVWRIRFDHHAAIVAAVDPGPVGEGPPRVLLLHQNFRLEDEPEDAAEVVRSLALDLGALRSGTVRAFRPVAEADAR